MQKRIALAFGLLIGLTSFGQSKAFDVDIRFFTPCTDTEIAFVETLCQDYSLEIDWVPTYQAARLSSNAAFSPSELILECLDQGIMVAAIASSFNYFKSGDMEQHKQTTLLEVKKRFALEQPARYKASLQIQQEIVNKSIDNGQNHPAVKAVQSHLESEK